MNDGSCDAWACRNTKAKPCLLGLALVLILLSGYGLGYNAGVAPVSQALPKSPRYVQCSWLVKREVHEGETLGVPLEIDGLMVYVENGRAVVMWRETR